MVELRSDSHLGQESLGANHRAQVRSQNLQRNLAIVLQIAREIYGSHTPRAKLSLYGISVS